jgi:hypothetical protein
MQFLIGLPEGNRLLGREDNNKMDLEGTGWESVD